MTGNKGAIVVQDVWKRYGHIDALRGLSLTVGQGEVFGLLGANGAGKTTLIKALIGALRYDSGTLTVLGYNPTRDKQAIRLRVGYMPQTAALYEDLSARDNVRFFARARPVPDLAGRVDSVLKFVSLSDRADDPVYGFSGGMKQRLSLACALVHQPDLLLLDEPSTGVDPKLREAFWGHFRALTEQGVTILLSTHQMDEALHCDRVAVMREGVALAVDSPRGLLERGRTSIQVWRGESVSEAHLRDYAVALPRLLDAPPEITRVQIEKSTLEDVVLDLIAARESGADAGVTLADNGARPQEPQEKVHNVQ